jgi:hypothetical protein
VLSLLTVSAATDIAQTQSSSNGVFWMVFLVNCAFVLATTVWVGYDAKALRDRSQRTFPPNPGAWVTGCLLMWIVFFPLYLIKRPGYAQGGRPSPSSTAASKADPTAQLERLSALHAAGSLSDQEFNAAKQRLLGRL